VTEAERAQLASCRRDERDGFTITVKADPRYLESYTVRALSYYLAKYRIDS